MKSFGLIGSSLSHSFSKEYFEDKFQRENIEGCAYHLFELKSIEQLPALLKSNPDLVGLNVTIPYKESVLAFLYEVSAEAKAVGAVNCITIESGKLRGFNTDIYGFEISLSKFIINNNTQAFVLGAGGSSKAVQYVLNKLQIPFKVVSRKTFAHTIAYSNIATYMKEQNLFVNTTPLGMYPDETQCPEIPYNKLTANDILFDLIYNPAETLFLKFGRNAGCKTQNGAEMLQLQAEKSWDIWNALLFP